VVQASQARLPVQAARGGVHGQGPRGRRQPGHARHQSVVAHETSTGQEQDAAHTVHGRVAHSAGPGPALCQRRHRGARVYRQG